ncbi:Hypothetical_protein [Hexamita inflata]|uniref:Hypothetical_protein n=1 Tax=Hexamita inflata TaxID=28002 RepID=A0AA86UYS5_9EUKA|nr:Hypothetical protein HINF_LOCUS40788 [Hexamita inflata]
MSTSTWNNVNGRAPTTRSPNREQDQRLLRPNFSTIHYKLEDPENWPMLHGTKSFMSREQKGSVDVMIDETQNIGHNKISTFIAYVTQKKIYYYVMLNNQTMLMNKEVDLLMQFIQNSTSYLD